MLQEEGFSPARAGPAYAPVLTNALPARQPSPLGLTNPSLNLRTNAFGDLFGPPSGSLPNVAVPNCPELPDWNHQRPYLTGQFLMEGLEAEEGTSGRQQALESFSSAVQEIVGTVSIAHCSSARFTTWRRRSDHSHVICASCTVSLLLLHSAHTAHVAASSQCGIMAENSKHKLNQTEVEH